MEWSYMIPHVCNFKQSVFCGEANLPTVMYVHDNASCLPRPNILEDLFYPLRVLLVPNNSSIINTASDNKTRAN